MTYQNVLQELKTSEKTKEGLNSFIGKMLANIAFDFQTQFGFPFEMFEEEIKMRAPTKGEQLTFILNYYKNK